MTYLFLFYLRKRPGFGGGSEIPVAEGFAQLVDHAAYLLLSLQGIDERGVARLRHDLVFQPGRHYPLVGVGVEDATRAIVGHHAALLRHVAVAVAR